MAIVDGCEWDVFISYAWKNNTTEPSENGERRWVVEFQSRLTERLNERLPSPSESSFFKDTQSIPINKDFETEIDAGLRKSAVMVALMSGRYRTSSYCQFEARRFAELHGGKYGGLAETGRVFVVNLENVHPDQWADFNRWFGRVTPLPFYSTISGLGNVSKFRTTSREFDEGINQLAANISRQLLQMREIAVAPHRGQPNESEPQFGRTARRGMPSRTATITLGACSDNETGWLNELERRWANDIRVIRTHEIDDAEPWREQFIANLDESDLFVQLIGEIPTRVSTDFPNGFAAAQVALARERLGERRVVQWRPWLRIPTQLTDPNQLRLAAEAPYFGSLVEFAADVRRQALETGSLLQSEREQEVAIRRQPHINASTSPEPAPSQSVGGARQIEQVVEKDSVAKRSGQSTPDGRKRIALVKVAASDDKLFDAISNRLREAQVASYKARNGTPIKSFVDHPSLACVGVVIVQGECDETWLSERALELVEVDADLKDRAPIQAFYVSHSEASLFYETDTVLKVVHGDPESTHKLLEAIRLRGQGL